MLIYVDKIYTQSGACIIRWTVMMIVQTRVVVENNNTGCNVYSHGVLDSFHELLYPLQLRVLGEILAD